MSRAVRAARTAFDHGPWPWMTPDERSDVLARMADGVAARAERLDRIAGAECGAIVAMAQGFRLGAQSLLSHFADYSRTFATSAPVRGLFSSPRSGCFRSASVR